MVPLSHDTQERRQALSLFRRSAANDPPTDQVIAEALDLGLNFLRADRALHAFRTSDAEPFLLSAGRGWEEGVIGSAHLSGNPASLGELVQRLKHPLIIDNFALFPQVPAEPLLTAADLKSALITPIQGQRGSSGLLAVFTSSTRLFSPEDAQFLRGVAEVIAAALYREDWRLPIASRHPGHRPEASDHRSP